MTFGDFIRAVKAELKKDPSIVFDYDWERLMSYKEFGIGRFDELLEIINGLKSNERFLSLPDFPVEKDENTFDWNMDKTPFYNGAKIGFGFSVYMPAFAPNIVHKSIGAINFATLFSMVQMSFNHDNQHFLTYEEDKAITLSFIIEYLTFFVEDFDNPDNQLVKRSQNEYVEFFKRVHDLRWEDKKTKDFEYSTFCVIVDTINNNEQSRRFITTLGHAVYYLIGCNALKEGRDYINFEDVVIGYLTVFKIILNDMRPLVYSLYDEEKWADENSWK